MFIDMLTVDLSRWQFGFTAVFHFLFVPLTLGLSWMLVIMEIAYIRTGKQVYLDMTKFWAKLFAINFAMGVVSGVTMEFEFGLNWAYFSRFIGDSFGAALAIEGITAFMVEAVLFGLFYFTWDKVKKGTHLAITFFLALGTNMSIVNILVANSWMQHPEGSYLNPETMTMNLVSFVQLYGQELAQIRVGHVAFAGYIVASTFVLGVSSFYLLKGRDIGFALRSAAIAIGFGLSCCIFTFFLGDANGLAVAQDEPEKMAGLEAQWETQPAPASWVLITWPDQTEEKNIFPIEIPWMLSLIAHHDLTGTVKGAKPIMEDNRQLIKQGLVALKAFENIRNGKADQDDHEIFNPNNEATAKYRDNIGYAFILQHFADNPYHATDSEMDQAVKETIPEFSTLFFGFRVMLACWGLLLLLFVLTFFFLINGTLHKRKWVLLYALFAIPLPYIAAEAGWIIAEVGRQPWIIRGIMPTMMGVSNLEPYQLITSLACFGTFYMTLLVIEVALMFKVAKTGPSGLGTGRYDLEQNQHRED